MPKEGIRKYFVEKVELDLDIRDKGKSILGKTKQQQKKTQHGKGIVFR